MSGLAQRIGLGEPTHRAWALYDVASSAFFTVVVTALFPIYFGTVYVAREAPAGATEVVLEGFRADATGALAWTTTIALAVAAVLAPIVGAIADRAPVKKRGLATCALIGSGATISLAFVQPESWLPLAVAFAVANVGVAVSIVLYDSLLRHIATDAEIDRVSTAGYAIGYAGGGLLLAGLVALVLMPETFGLADAGTAVRVSFVAVGVWWLAFSIPLLRRVPEPPIAEQPGGGAVAGTFIQLARTLRELRKYRHATLFLVAFLLYSDGIGTIIRMATIYGQEIGLGTGALIGAILLVQVIGIPCTFGFGQIAGKVGPKPALYGALVAYIGVSVLGYFMSSAVHFFILAGIVGVVQGGCQALSRSLFATLIPRHKSAELFALFSVSEKMAGIFGPLVFGLAIVVFGSGRSAILSVILFFLAGAALLFTVDVEAGKQAARTAEAEAEAS